MLSGMNFIDFLGGGGGGEGEGHMFSYGHTEYHICPYRESIWYLKDKESFGKVGVLVAKYRTCHFFKYAQI